MLRTVRRHAPRWLKNRYRAFQALGRGVTPSSEVLRRIGRGEKLRIDYGRLAAEVMRRGVIYPPEYVRFRMDGSVEKAPSTVNVETTTKCQLACKMCDRKGLERGIEDMNPAVFERAIDEIARVGAAAQFNRFGEPLLDKGLPNRILYAKRKGIRCVHFTTNGMLLNEKKAMELVEAGVNRITISYDGASKETFESIRVNSSQETVDRNIKGLLRAKRSCKAEHLEVNLRVTILDENKDEVLDIYRRWMGVVSRIVPCIVFEYRNVNLGEHIVAMDGARRNPCGAFLGRSVVCADGRVIMCCVGDINGALKVGDMRTDSIEACYSGPDAARIRDAHRNSRYGQIPVCDECVFTFEKVWVSENLQRLLDEEARKVVLLERLAGISEKESAEA